MAARFWRGTTSTAWNNTGNWSDTSGGATGFSVPTAADDVTLDANGNNPCTLNVNGVALSLTIDAGYTSTLTFTGTLSVSGNITLNTGVTFAGANRLLMIQSGTFTSNGKTINVPVSLGTSTGATSPTITLADALNVSADLALGAGTSTTFVGAFDIAATSATVSGTQTVTLSGNVSIAGLTTISGSEVINGAFDWSTLSLSVSGSSALSGTATIVFTGTGSWTHGNSATTVANNVTIAAGAGTLTITAGTIGYRTGTLTYTSGTVDTTGVTLSIGASTTLDTAGMTWPNVTLTAALTLTLNSLLTVTGTLTLPNANVTFAGTDGWTVAALTHSSGGGSDMTFTFVAGETYTITSAYTAPPTSNPANTYKYVSSSPGTTVNFTLQAGASQDVGYVDPTDMDASAGDEIFTYRGVITNSDNWTNVHTPGGGGGTPVVHAYAYAG